MSDKLQHGGRRKGAGRRPEGSTAKVKTSIAVDAALLGALDAEAAERGIARNKLIETALEERIAVAAYGTLPPLALPMLGLIAVGTSQSGYIASWHISKVLPGASDLDVVCSEETPGNAAMRALILSGIVEQVPDLPCRYRLRP